MQKYRIVCLGDSLTQGYNLPVESRWTNLLESTTSTKIINCGVNGDTTAGMLARLPLILKEHRPTHIIILGGTNDVWFGLPNAHIVANIHAMIRQAKYDNVLGIVGIPTSIHTNDFNILSEPYKERMVQFQKTLVEYCINDQRTYIPFHEQILDDHFLEDGLHINAEGQTVMKNQVYTLLQTIL